MAVADRDLAWAGQVLRLHRQVQIDVRPVEAAEPGDQPARAESGQGGDSEAAVVAVGGIGEAATEVVERRGDVPSQRRPGFRQIDAVRGAAEQRQPGSRLQLLHVIADGGSRGAELARRLREAAEARRRFKGFDRNEGRQAARHSHA